MNPTHLELKTDRLATQYPWCEVSAENENQVTLIPKVGSKYNAAMKVLRNPPAIRRLGKENIRRHLNQETAAFGDAQSELKAVLAKNSGQSCAG